MSAENAAARPANAAPHVSIRAIYADAMREVMADPGKAIAEHDPWLAVLLGRRPAHATPKS
ncbi:MAG: hypothetical protein ACXW2G_05005 [Burkholderiaceae bacterium]